MVAGDEEFVKANIPDYLYPYYDIMRDSVVKVAEEEANKPKRTRKKKKREEESGRSRLIFQ